MSFSERYDRLVKTAIIIMGISGISAQVLLLRELLIISFGNELIIGIILANWLLLEALGSWLGGKLKLKRGLVLFQFIFFQVLFACSLPFCLVMTRFAKEYTGVLPGSGMGLIVLFISSLFILLPVGLTHGLLFPTFCQLISHHKGRESGTINRVYVWELLGTIIGGVVLTYILIPHFHTLRIALVISLLNLIICVVLFAGKILSENIFDRHDNSGGKKDKKPYLYYTLIIGTIILLSLLNFTNIYILPHISDDLHNYSIERQWRGHNVIHYQNSIYGNITVTESEGQLNFFADGQPVVISPDADITLTETLVHLPLLLHPEPSNILIIGGGAGGVISEVLKHAPHEIVYTEIDPLLINLIEQNPTDLTEYELQHPSVKVELLDGRRYVEQKDKEFDIILIGIGQPDDLQANRLFTEDFYRLLQTRMKPAGILSFTLPGSLTYLTREMQQLNKITENTLQEVFAHHFVVPGDFNLFLASQEKEMVTPSADLLSARLFEREIETELISEGYLEYILHHRWQDWYSKSTEKVSDEVNRDILPVSVFWALSYWNSIFSPTSQRIFQFFHDLSFRVIFRWLFVAVVLLLLMALLFQKRPLLLSLPLTIVTSGFSGMLLDLAIIYIFQILFGYVFLWIGMLFVSYMSGAMIGALYMSRKMSSQAGDTKQALSKLIYLDVLIILFALSLPLAIGIFNALKITLPFYHMLSFIFLLIPFLSGFFIGSQFPLAVKIYLRQSGSFEKSSGILYALDLTGGWFGGIIGGVFLLPLFGLTKTMMLILLLKASSLILLTVLRIKNRG